MPDHLVFTLASAFGAMGELAGHERRGTLTWPGRSAILGLLGAALGLRRDDAAGLAALDPIRMAVGVHDEGAPMRDYHTVTTVPSALAKRPDSRPAALRAAGRDANTTITLRDYRVGPLYTVALWDVPLEPSLEALAEALRRPVFALWLGRKSCPLAAPPAPRIVAAEEPLAALAAARIPGFRWTRGRIDGPCSLRPPLRLVASDIDLGGGRVETRNDVPLDRTRWHFGPRAVHLWTPGGRTAP